MTSAYREGGLIGVSLVYGGRHWSPAPVPALTRTDRNANPAPTRIGRCTGACTDH